MTAVDGFAFPTHPKAPGGPLAAAEGTLIEADGCLWIGADSGEIGFVVIWPNSFDLVDLNGPTVVGDDQVFHLGDRLTMSGGTYPSSTFDIHGIEVMSPECASAEWFLADDPKVVEPG